MGERASRKGGDSGDSVDKLFDEADDAEQEHSVERDDGVLEDTIAKDVLKVAIEKTKKSKRKSKTNGDASAFTFPPKKLRDDYHVATSITGRKSLATIFSLVSEGSSIPSGIAEPQDDGLADSVFGLNLRTCPPSKRYVISSDDSYHSDSRSEVNFFARSTVADTPIITIAITTTVAADAFGSTADVSGSKTKDAEIAHLKSLLSLKETRAAKAIYLRSQLSIVEVTDAAKSTELRDLKEINFAIEGEKDALSEKVSSSLESALGLFKEHIEAMQDDQATVLGNRDGLKVGVDHGKVRRDLSVIEAYDLFAETKSINAVNALGAVYFSLLSQLKSKKDASMVDLIDSLRLDGPLAKIPRAKDLQPEACTFATPVTTKPITTLSITFTSFGVIPPLSISNDQVLDTKLNDADPPAVTFKTEELATSPE
nr:hypothetical protein [Tanacetum cinerariifolium]